GGLDVAILPTSALKPGVHTITAVYTGQAPQNNGDTNFNASAPSAGVTETVQVASTVQVSSSGSPSGYRQGVNFTATVFGQGQPAFFPTGPDTVTFWDGPVNTGINLGTMTLDSAGKAVLSGVTSLLASATPHTISVSFSGDTVFLPGTGTAQQLVNKAGTTTT